jgi:hypothetical protein
MILSGIKARVYNYLHLVPGTVARPNCPNGKKALFYRDEKGVHRPLFDHLKMKFGFNDNIRARIGFLGEAKYFRQMLGIDERVAFLPREIRRLVFDENKMAAWKRFAVNRHFDFIWNGEGLKTFCLEIEPKSGTLFMQPGAWARIRS